MFQTEHPVQIADAENICQHVGMPFFLLLDAFGQ